MMGLGSFDYGGGSGVGGGGSSSSSISSLSPLAPPFTIVTSHPKPKSKPYGLDQLSVDDPYAFTSYSSNNWLHLHPPPTPTLSDSFTSPNLEIDSICATSIAPTNNSSSNNSNYTYGQPNKPYYFDAPSISSRGGVTSNSVPILSSTATSSGFPHVQPSEKVVNSLISEACLDPYYHQTHYPSAGIGHKKSSHPVVIKKPDGSDILTISGVATPFEMSNPIHQTQYFPGLDYSTTTWGGFWNRTGEWEEQGSRKDLDRSLGLTEKVLTGSSTCKSLPKEGAPVADGWTACGEASGVSIGKPLESLTGIYRTGTITLNAKGPSSSEEESTRSSLHNMSRQSMFSSSSFLPEIAEVPYSEEPYPGSWSQLNSNNNLFNRISSCSDNPAFYSSMAYDSLGIQSRPLTRGTSSSAPKKSIIPTNVNSIDKAVNSCFINEDLKGSTPSSFCQKDPLIQLTVEHKESVADTVSVKDEMDRTNHFFMNSLAAIKDTTTTRGSPIINNSSYQFFNGGQENQLTFCDTSTYTPAAADSVENSTETFDRFNPIVDSPCWKGSQAFRSSPFAGKEVQGPQIFCVDDGADAAAFFHPEHGSPFSKENGHEGNDNISSSSRKPALELSIKHGVRFSCGSQEPMKECFAPSNEEEKVTSTRVPDHTDPVWEGANTLASKKLVPRVDVRLLVNTLDNLSALLLASCSNGVYILEEQDNEVLQRVTSNLHTCASMKVGSMPESNFKQSFSSCSGGSLPDPHKGVAVGRSQVTREDPSVIQSQFDNQTALKGKMNSNMCNKKEDMFQAFVSQIVDTDFEKDDDMTQRIKKHLKENVDDDEDKSLSRIQLYRNLWLEAEAAVCSMKYNARCASMKIEMEKDRLQQEKGKSINLEQQPSLKISNDLNCFEALSGSTKDSSITKTKTQEESQSNTMNQVEDLEAAVMARLQLLKCRVDSSSSMNTEGKQLQNSIKDSSITKTTTQEATHANTSNQVEDTEASVMARLNILRSRVDNNSSSMITEGKQLWGSTDDVANAETSKNTFSLGGLSVRNVGIMTPPTQMVGLGLSKRSKLWPVTGDDFEDETSDAKGTHDVRNQSANNIENLVLDNDVPEQQVTVKEFRVCVPDESIVQSYIPDIIPKRVPVGGYDSPSSDWEHVLKDDFTWQN